MIKKYIILAVMLLVTGVVVVTPVSHAQEETQTETEDSTEKSDIKDKINDLKDRLATKVAELKEQNKRSFYGVIKELEDTSMVLLYHEEEIPVALDDETVFYSIDLDGDQSEIEKDSFELGETAVVYGELDLDNKTVIATFLYQQQLPLINHGIVTDVDTDDGSFTIDSSTGNITLDYEISSVCTWMQDGQAERCGLSRINAGDRVFLRIESDEEDISRGTVLRMLLVPNEAKPTAAEKAPETEAVE